MLRVRMHGRGGQGTKTAARILGSALFAEGLEVQDAPRYGAERRGAPIFATVRAARSPVRERGVIRDPDLVVVVDPTLLSVSAAAVLEGVDQHCTLLIRSDEPEALWSQRLELRGPIVTLPARAAEADAGVPIGAACAGAAARLLGCVRRESLERAVRQELGERGDAVVARNLRESLAAFDAMAPHEGRVRERAETQLGARPPDWIELPLEAADRSAPDVHATLTSVEVRTGLWRTMRPLIDLERCNRCHWICGTLCPDGAIAADPAGAPRIDYDHCKGCLICVAVCPAHAIHARPERAADEAGEARP